MTTQPALPLEPKQDAPGSAHGRQGKQRASPVIESVSQPPPQMLFCMQNAGRSQIAAAIAAHLAPGKVHVRSAGSRPTGQIKPLAVQVLAERGIELTEAYPKPLSNDVLHAADVIVTMGCGDECPYFPGKRYEDWDVFDPDKATLEQARDIRDDIQRRVTELLRDLGI